MAFFKVLHWLDKNTGGRGVLCLVAVGGAVLVSSVVLLLVWIRKRRLKRKKRLQILTRKSLGELPKEGDTYARNRLQTALSTLERAGDVTRKSVPYENRGEVRLGYARRLLAGVQDAPLLPAERLEADWLAREIGAYALRERWEAEELRAVNDLFARLLKLAAKYSVEG